MLKTRLIAFFILAPAIILTSSLFLLQIEVPKTEKVPASVTTGIRIFASRPETPPEVKGVAIEADARPELVKQYLASFNSPLTKFSNLIVAEADKASIDFRFIPAIARQESGLCKIIPENSYNCWGWGITGSSTLYFKSYEEAIRTVTEGLKDHYIDEGLTTPTQIMNKYTPLSNGSWAKGVSEFMEDLK